jgi:hypothetical protein
MNKNVNNVYKNFGFIITRHVNSPTTNKYWNQCVKCIRTFYPFIKIVIIDDNSDKQFVKSDFDYKNVEIIESHFPKRGELLPYFYFLRRQFFENAIIIHDSVFFHKRIHFELFSKMGINVLPLWHFDADKENLNNSLRISSCLNNSLEVQKSLSLNDILLGMGKNKWYGVFGVQSFINLKFLMYLESKYKICNMIQSVKCREDRCCLERIMGCIFFTESRNLYKKKSLFGRIYDYQQWGYNYNNYVYDIKNKRLPKSIIKIWTGR